MKKTHLLIIDPQNDFCDIAGAALPVAEGPAESVASVSAAAAALVATIPAPIPRATARPPTRPTKFDALVFIAIPT